jgi:hypothetical protein
VAEPVSLTLGAVVAALLTKAAEKGGENLADAAKAAVGRLIGWSRDRFTRDGDEEGSQALAWAEGAPDSRSRMRVLAEVTGGRRADPEFKSLVQRLVDDAKQGEGLRVGSVTQSASGNQHVQVVDNQGAVNVAYGQSQPASASR